MDFHSFLDRLIQMSSIHVLEARVQALSSILAYADDEEVGLIVHLCHRDWPWLYPKVQFLLPDIGSRDEQINREPSVGEVYQLIAKTLEANKTDKANVLSLPSLNDRFSDAEINWIHGLLRGHPEYRLNERTILEALALSEHLEPAALETLRRAYGLTRDMGIVAKILRKNGLEVIKETTPIVGIPILRERMETLTIGAAWERLGPCFVEFKYDGYYCQIHKRGDQVLLYSGKDEDWGIKYPELFAETKHWVRQQIRSRTAILEAELMGYDLQKKRIPREQFWQASQYRAIVFDILLINDEDWTGRPYRMRRDRLRKLVSFYKEGGGIQFPFEVSVDSLAGLVQIYEKCKQSGLEGIITKSPDFIYRPGQKSLGRFKVKPQETIDATVVGLKFASGQNEVTTPNEYLLAVYDSDSDTFPTIGYVGRGLDNSDRDALLLHLRDLRRDKPLQVVTDEKPDQWVEPKIVVEIAFDRIVTVHSHRQQKPTVNLVGARFIKDPLRTMDKRPEDSTTLEYLNAYAKLDH